MSQPTVKQLSGDSSVVRTVSGAAIGAIRSVREFALMALFGRCGIRRSVNGTPLRVLPQCRWYFVAEFDAPVAEYFRTRVPAGAVCISVGSNIGAYPLQFAHWAGPTGKILAFEPNPKTAELLRQHITLNQMGDRVEVVERAISDQRGSAAFYLEGVDGMSRLGEANPKLSCRTTTINVSVDTLDHFCREHIVRPDVLMMDIEGFEIAALRGARGLFTSGAPPVAVIEFHPNAWAVAGTTRADLEQLLADYQLRVVPLSSQTDPLAEYGHVALEPELR